MFCKLDFSLLLIDQSRRRLEIKVKGGFNAEDRRSSTDGGIFAAPFTKYRTTILRLSYDNDNVTID